VPPEIAAARPARRRLYVWLTVAGWALICTLISASLLIDHLISLPAPAAADPEFQHLLARQRPAAARGRWWLVHVIADGCGCSRRVVDHLIADRRPADLAERVVFVTEHARDATPTLAELALAGFAIDVVRPDELVARYGVEAAPLLIAIAPDGALRYVGGYTRRKQAADLHDLDILAALRRGEPVEPYPAFGCAVGDALRSKLDPLGIKR